MVQPSNTGPDFVQTYQSNIEPRSLEVKLWLPKRPAPPA
jgi:hypothetical protein